jgi:hypothetical protein
MKIKVRIMEQIIRQIINHVGMQIYETTEVFTVEHASKKITEHITMFIDWLAKEVTLKLVWKDGSGYVKQWHFNPDGWFEKHASKEWKLEELFEYWYKNVK